MKDKLTKKKEKKNITKNEIPKDEKVEKKQKKTIPPQKQIKENKKRKEIEEETLYQVSDEEEFDSDIEEKEEEEEELNLKKLQKTSGEVETYDEKDLHSEDGWLTKIRYDSLDINDGLKKSIKDMGFEYMTEIQAKSLPQLLAGKDLLAQAKTGSGKTLA